MWKEYFDFTHQEKRGILLLVVLIILASLAGYFYKPTVEKPTASAEQIARLEKYLESNKAMPDYFQAEKPQEPQENSLFPFDPNKLSLEDGLRLNLSEKQIRVIHLYIAKGGKFLTATDLEKIYSLNKIDLERLTPWVRIPEDTISYASEDPTSSMIMNDTVRSIDLNSCTIDDLLKFKCLTRPMAERIIKFRDKLGGFYTAEQLKEVYGLQGNCLNRLQQLALGGPSAVKKLSINFATRSELASHPYLGQSSADKIEQYRLKNGFISEAEILLQNQLIDANKLEKLLPYLIFRE